MPRPLPAVPPRLRCPDWLIEEYEADERDERAAQYAAEQED